MTTWHESRTRSLAYRAVIKTRVEAEKRFGPTPAVRRGLGRLNRHNLSWLAAVYGSDKGAISHGYVDLYEQYLAGMRRRARLLDFATAGSPPTPFAERRAAWIGEESDWTGAQTSGNALMTRSTTSSSELR